VQTLRVLVTLIGVGLAVAGCASKERHPFFPTYPVVSWSALAAGQDVEVSDGYRLLVTEPTQGVFPASIGVARLAGRITNNGDALLLAMKPDVDFLSWNSRFDDFRSVSEVFPVNAMALDGADVEVSSILASARALRAGLLLVYTEEQNTPEQYDVRGMIYEVKTRRPLASLHASAYVQQPVEPDEHYSGDDPVHDLDRKDPRLIAIKSFEQHARACLLALMANDEPAETVAPEGWIPDRPIDPILWPPLDERLRGYDPRFEP